MGCARNIGNSEHPRRFPHVKGCNRKPQNNIEKQKVYHKLKKGPSWDIFFQLGAWHALEIYTAKVGQLSKFRGYISKRAQIPKREWISWGCKQFPQGSWSYFVLWKPSFLIPWKLGPHHYGTCVSKKWHESCSILMEKTSFSYFNCFYPLQKKPHYLVSQPTLFLGGPSADYHLCDRGFLVVHSLCYLSLKTSWMD